MIDSREPQKDVADMLSHSHSVEKKQNGEMIMIIMQSLLYLSRQNIALRGHDDNESNFIQLLKLRSHDNEVRRFNFIVAMSHNIISLQEICGWLAKKADKYTSGEIQNEFLKIMGHQILRAIIEQSWIFHYNGGRMCRFF